jgi:hypothetical protein
MVSKDELLRMIMKRVDTSSTAVLLTDVIIVWQTLARKFSPLLGPASVHALFMRGLDRNRADFPWLPPVYPDDDADTVFGAFEATLRTRTGDEVTRVTQALLCTYLDALFSLIGVTLTVQFVRAAFRDDGERINTEKRI